MKLPLFLLILLVSTSCSDYQCLESDTIETLGQCSYSKYGVFGSTTCVALTENGHKIIRSSPFVVGEQVCLKYGVKKKHVEPSIYVR